MEFNLPGIESILARTPQTLRTLLEGLPDELVRTNYGPDTWSPHEVIGHLIHGEKTDWLPRARLILQAGEAVAFEPFDRNGHVALCHERSPDELLDLFESLRIANLAELRSMSIKPADLGRYGRHPALGRVTLSQLLAAWAVHDLNHIAQVCKGIAYQQRNEVGPWKAYLSILAPPSPR
jgi:DinB family protein